MNASIRSTRVGHVAPATWSQPEGGEQVSDFLISTDGRTWRSDGLPLQMKDWQNMTFLPVAGGLVVMGGDPGTMIRGMVVAAVAPGPTDAPGPTPAPAGSPDQTVAPAQPAELPPPTLACPAPAVAARVPDVTVAAPAGAPVPATRGSSTLMTCSTTGTEDAVPADPLEVVAAHPGDHLTLALPVGWGFLRWEGSDRRVAGEGANAWPPVDVAGLPPRIEVPVPDRQGHRSPPTACGSPARTAEPLGRSRSSFASASAECGSAHG